MAVVKPRTSAPVLRGAAFNMRAYGVPRRVGSKFIRVKRANMAASKVMDGSRDVLASPPKATNNTHGYGLAIMHDFTTFGEETWSHSGGTLGYTSFMIWLKSQNIFITVNGSAISSAIPEKRDLFYLTKDIVSFLQK